MTRPVTLLLGSACFCWVGLSYPAWRLGGAEALVYSTVAALLALVPTLATVWFAEHNQSKQAGTALLLLAGSGVRMAVVLGVGLLICAVGLPGLGEVEIVAFWLWILCYYLCMLLLEVRLLLSGQIAGNVAAQGR